MYSKKENAEQSAFFYEYTNLYITCAGEIIGKTPHTNKMAPIDYVEQ